MAKRTPKPNWTSLKSHLSTFDKRALLGLLQDLYAASPDNQAFLHARFGSGEDTLKPYKKTLARWIAPNVQRDQDISIKTAKQAIADYKKAGTRWTRRIADILLRTGRGIQR